MVKGVSTFQNRAFYCRSSRIWPSGIKGTLRCLGPFRSLLPSSQNCIPWPTRWFVHLHHNQVHVPSLYCLAKMLHNLNNPCPCTLTLNRTTVLTYSRTTSRKGSIRRIMRLPCRIHMFGLTEIRRCSLWTSPSTAFRTGTGLIWAIC